MANISAEVCPEGSGAQEAEIRGPGLSGAPIIPVVYRSLS